MAAHPSAAVCPREECITCAERDCPHKDPLHYHHDGCPSCYSDYVAMHSRGDGKEPASDSDHDNDEGDGGSASDSDYTYGKDHDGQDHEGEAYQLLLAQRLNDGAVDIESELAEFGAREGAQSEYPTLGKWEEPTSQKVKDVAAAFRRGEKGLNDLVFDLSGVKWGVCDWGSCQYATAQAMFDALRRLRGAGLDPLAVVGWGASASVIPEALDLKVALRKIAASFEGLTPEERQALENTASLDSAFEVMRGCRWDLWTAASHTSQLVFGTTFEDIEARVNASPGRGASVNILCQSDNYTTALRCYALWSAGYVKMPVTAFGDFDT